MDVARGDLAGASPRCAIASGPHFAGARARGELHASPLAMSLAHVRTVTIAALLASTTGCAAIGDIFKAGVWVGVVVVGFVIALIFGLVRIFGAR
jgi:hypothetical protein